MIRREGVKSGKPNRMENVVLRMHGKHLSMERANEMVKSSVGTKQGNWTEEEYSTLVDLWSSGINYLQAAIEMRRSAKVVRNYFVTLNKGEELPLIKN